MVAFENEKSVVLGCAACARRPFANAGSPVSGFLREIALVTALMAVGVAATAEGAETKSAPSPLEPSQRTDVFVSGKEGYHTFRIPAVLVSPKGTLLAFCEGRKNSRSDTGDIDLLLKRSRDGGKTWSPPIVVWDDEGNTCGNPCPVVDESTGRIWLPMTWNDGRDPQGKIVLGTAHDTRRVFLTWSDDDGRTWAKPQEITAQVKPPQWTWYATGPCNGIQLRRGKHAGRLVIPCDHYFLRKDDIPAEGRFSRWSHCIYSDDHGKTWQVSRPAGKRTNESTVVELADGRLMLNMRSYHGTNRRAVSLSEDGGRTWSRPQLDETLIEPVCEGSLLRYTWPKEGRKSRILFANPASTQREKMTVRLSDDEGRTWPEGRLIDPGSAAYSCLTVLPDGRIGLLYERDGYGRITFVAFTLEEFTDGRDRLGPAPG